MAVALYKGPPHDGWWHWICHYAVRIWTRSRWSHAELVIDGVCFSSSPRDGGVRSKVIDLSSGRWDVFQVAADEAQALRWFGEHVGNRYDWAGIWRFVVPFLPHARNRWFCFESVGSALGLAGAHKLHANDLHAWAVAHAPKG